MIRALSLIVVAIFFLLLLDFRVIGRRVFYIKSVEPFLNWKVTLWARGIINLCKLFIGLKAHDETPREFRDQLPPRFIALSNHQSLLDILLIFFLFPKNQMRFVAKEALKHGFPGVSQTLRFQHHALIQRKGNARNLVELMARYARRCAKKGYCPAIFPEGTRSRSGELQKFQPAGLRMILDRGSVPLVVVTLDGGSQLATMPDFLLGGNKVLKMKIVGILPAPQGKEDTLAALEKARAMIQAQLVQWRSGSPS